MEPAFGHARGGVDVAKKGAHRYARKQMRMQRSASEERPTKQKPAQAGRTSLVRINFMARRHVASALSVVLILASLLSLGLLRLNFGLDFTGGTLLEVAYAETVSVDDVRGQLDEAGYANASVVYYGSDKELLIRLQSGDDVTTGDALSELLRTRSTSGALELRRVEFVGPQVGSELREQGGLALLTALILVMFYVGFRFQFKFAIGAVVALFHDVLIVFGLFSVMRWNFDLTVLAALLAVIGYSLNDTIVVSDRIRENFYRQESLAPQEVIDVSLNQTLMRTLITSLTTLLVLFSLLLLGGEQVRGFALALIVGVVFGTYSSIYVSSNLLLVLDLSRDDLVDENAGQREGGEI